MPALGCMVGFLAVATAFLVPTQTLFAQDATLPPATETPAAAEEDDEEEPANLWDMAANATIGAILSPVALLAYAIFAIAQGILWVAGIIFNWSIVILVFEFSKHLGNSTGMLLGWSILRDLGNILLLFGFVTIGIRMILNVEHHGAGKALSQLIIFAALLNFSLFAAEAVVDTSNALTYALYAQSAETVCAGDKKACQLNDGIAGQILQQVNIISVVEGGGSELGADKVIGSYFSDPIASIINYLLLALIVTIAATVLFAGAILLITRGVTLAFLLVTSPIGFAGMAIPALHDMSTQWWKALVNNALFAPVFLILLFVGLRLTDGLRELSGAQGGFVSAISGGNSLDAGPIFLFVLVIGFMVAALTFAKRFSIAGADFAIQTATRAASAPFVPGQHMLGMAAERSGKAYNRFAANLSANKKIPAPLRVLGGAFARPFDSAIKDTFSAGQKVALPGWGSYADEKKKREAREKELKGIDHAEHLKRDIKEGMSDPVKLNKLASKLSLNDWKHTPQFEEGAEGIENVAKALPANVFKAAMADKDILDEVKDKMRASRFENFDGDSGVINSAATNVAGAKDKFDKISGSDLAMSGVTTNPTRRAQVAVLASDTQFEELLKGDLGDDVKNELRDIRNGTRPGDRFDTTAPAGEGQSNAEKTLEKMGPAKIADLPANILTNPGVLALLEPHDFFAIAQANKLGKNTRPVVRNHVAALRTNPLANPTATRKLNAYLAGLSREQQGVFNSYYA